MYARVWETGAALLALLGNDDTGVARIKGHRVLGTGKATFEVSALGFGVMGMTYRCV